MKYLTLFLLLFSKLVYGQYTVESVPNQKLINGSYVSNPDGVLDAGTVADIDALLRALEDSTTVQVAVVALNSIGDADVFEFAQELFTRWGIGSKAGNNGLLVLLVRDSHIIRFHTGSGLEGALPDALCKRIQQTAMVPAFKSDDYDAGMLAGLQEVVKILTDPAYGEELRAGESGSANDFAGTWLVLAFFVLPVFAVVFIVKLVNKSFADSKSPSSTLYPEMRLTRVAWLIGFIGVPAVIVAGVGLSVTDNPLGFAVLGLYLYYLLTLLHRQWRMKRVMNRLTAQGDYHGVVEFLRKEQVYWFFIALVFPLPFVFYFVYHLFRKRRYRNHPRQCAGCQGKMHKLSEKADDAFLSKAQLLEENIRSVDYDVWQCESCQATAMWNYPRRFSKYKPCTYCKAKTGYLVSHTTIVSPTYSSSGRGEDIYGCMHCGKEEKSAYTIAKLEHSSGSSSSGGSSSGGGSWGGGSSGGGGASSSW